MGSPPGATHAARQDAERELAAARRRLAEARRLASQAQSDYFRGMGRDHEGARAAYYAAFRAELDAEERVRDCERRVDELDAPAPRARRPA